MISGKLGRILRAVMCLAMAALLLAACAPRPTGPVVGMNRAEFPEPNRLTHAALGEAMAEFRVIQEVEAIRFRSAYEPSPEESESVHVRIPVGEIFPLGIYGEPRPSRFAPETKIYVGHAEDLRRNGLRRPAILSFLSDEFLIIRFMGEDESYQFVEVPASLYERVMVPMRSEENRRKVLLYAGRRGDTIGLVYLEFTADMANPDHSQELSFDLADGNVIEVQGVRFQIIDASSWRITFRRLNDAAGPAPAGEIGT